MTRVPSFECTGTTYSHHTIIFCRTGGAESRDAALPAAPTTRPRPAHTSQPRGTAPTAAAAVATAATNATAAAATAAASQHGRPASTLSLTTGQSKTLLQLTIVIVVSIP